LCDRTVYNSSTQQPFDSFERIYLCAGNDLNEDTSPVEASLTWTIGKRRREKFDFPGGEIIKKQIAEGITRRRVGILSVGAPARAGSDIVNAAGEKVRHTDSGFAA
jgi:aminomethyltransferase